MPWLLRPMALCVSARRVSSSACPSQRRASDLILTASRTSSALSQHVRPLQLAAILSGLTIDVGEHDLVTPYVAGDFQPAFSPSATLIVSVASPLSQPIILPNAGDTLRSF